VDGSKDTIARLRAAVQPFIAHADKAEPATPTQPTGPLVSNLDVRHRNKMIREWAERNGYSVAAKGMIPREIINLYEADLGADQRPRTSVDDPTLVWATSTPQTED